MPSSCLPAARDAVRAAARALDDVETVHHAEALAPDEGPIDGWTLELSVTARAAGATPRIQRELITRELTVREVAPQASHWRLVIVY